MEIPFSQEIIYDIKGPPTVADVIAALLAAEELFRETIPMFQAVVPGLAIEGVRVSVREVSEGSLKEVLGVAVLAAFQPDIAKEMQPITEKLFGQGAHDYNNLLSVLLLVVLFYGADYIYTHVNKTAVSRRIRAQLDDTIKSLSREFGIPEDRVSKILEQQYQKGRLRLLGHSVIKFFSPSKRHNNAPILIGKKKIDEETVREVPGDAQIEAAEVPEIYQPFRDVQIELHAQDMDRAKQGWAAIVPQVGKKRLRMEIYPPIKPEDIYTKTKLRGDIMLVLQKKNDGSYEPSMFHLTNLTEAT